MQGHLISFLHDGPQILTRHFTEAWQENFLSRIQLLFVGPEGQVTELERKALGTTVKSLQLRPHVLYNHLVLRRAIEGHEDHGLPNAEDIRELCESLRQRIAERARHVENDAVELASKPSDVANIRDIAMDADHAAEVLGQDSEGCSDRVVLESTISLDPVGVFARDRDPLTGSVLDGMVAVLRDSDTPDLSADSLHNVHDPTSGGGEDRNDDELYHRENQSEAEDSKQQPYRCVRQGKPVNEFEHNDDLLYGAFWYLFPLGKGLRKRGSLALLDIRHMLTQFHNAFAQQPSLLFLLADQIQRHSACRGVALRVKTDPLSFQDFRAMVADKDAYMKRLIRAKEDPTSQESRALLKQVLRFSAAAGKAVPWSGEERAAEITKLYAMWRRFGPPSAFLTCAPDDVHQSKSIQLSFRAGHSKAFPASPTMLLRILREDAMPEDMEQFMSDSLQAAPDASSKFQLDERFLQKLATMNPVATTLVYEQMTEAIFTELVQLAPVLRRKTQADMRAEPVRGFLGVPFAWTYVHEVSGRKAFHFHASVHGGPSPALLTDVLGSPALEKAVCQALDSIYKAYVSPEIHALDAARRFLKVPACKLSYFQQESMCTAEDVSLFDARAAITAVTTGLHSHAATCRKGLSGKEGCRMARPAGHPVDESRVVSVEIASTSSAGRSEGAPDEAACSFKCEYCGSNDDFRVARTSREHCCDTRACISYELKRPHVTADRC